VLVILAINYIVLLFSIKLLSYHTIVETCRSSYLSLIVFYSVHMLVDVPFVIWHLQKGR